MIVKFFGTNTAFYNDRSYFPGEVFEAPDRIPLRNRDGTPLLDEKGEPVTKPLVLSARCKLRLATEEEQQEYYRTHPRALRREENNEIRERDDTKRNRKTRANNPLKADGIVS